MRLSNNIPKRPVIWRLVGAAWADWMMSALRELQMAERHIDQLNVFPVPDGDTGRNMVATLRAAVDRMQYQGIGSLDTVFSNLAEGALMGARGNSGVILSQLLTGFAETAHDKRFFEPADLIGAFRQAASRARRQVASPVEGTILTVADAMAQSAEGSDIIAVLDAVVQAGELALRDTPNQLPVLAEAGVVDAGAEGYLILVRGLLNAARGESRTSSLGWAEPRKDASPRADLQTLRYFYDVEALLYKIRHADPEGFLRSGLSAIGDSIVIGPGRDSLKVHVHTDRAVELTAILTQVGDIRQMEWLDMRCQLEERQEAPSLTVVVGEDWHPIFACCRTVSPKTGQDGDNTLWIHPPAPVTRALAISSVALAGQLVMDYDAMLAWEENRRRLSALMDKMRLWVVERLDKGYRLQSRIYSGRDELAQALWEDVGDSGIITVYLSQNARQEEAAFWQEALNAALVQVPHRDPWMEIVWQP